MEKMPLRTTREPRSVVANDLVRQMFVYMMACIAASGKTHLEIAAALDIPLSELREKLLNHQNWTLDTISDLCVAIDVVPEFNLIARV